MNNFVVPTSLFDANYIYYPYVDLIKNKKKQHHHGLDIIKFGKEFPTMVD